MSLSLAWVRRASLRDISLLKTPDVLLIDRAFLMLFCGKKPLPREHLETITEKTPAHGLFWEMLGREF
jgi:hypothetical protein